MSRAAFPWRPQARASRRPPKCGRALGLGATPTDSPRRKKGRATESWTGLGDTAPFSKGCSSGAPPCPMLEVRRDGAGAGGRGRGRGAGRARGPAARGSRGSTLRPRHSEGPWGRQREGLSPSRAPCRPARSQELCGWVCAGRCSTWGPGRQQGPRRPRPGGPRTQAAGAVGTWTGGARRPGSRRPWLQSRLGRATRAHRDTDAHASGKITPRGHAHREPLEGRGCDGEREGIVTSFLGRVRQTQELTGDTGYEKNSCQNQNYLKRVTYVVTEI